MCLLLSCFVGGAMAAPKEKSTILHCGCNETGDGMVYKEITISSRSKGHVNHVVGSVDSCFDGLETYTDVVRTGDDCLVAGPNLANEIAVCEEDGPVAGDDCGALVLTP